MRHFDSAGFACNEVNEGAVGMASKDAPADATKRWNWNGFDWIGLDKDYAPPLPAIASEFAPSTDLRERQKEARQALVEAIKVTTASGKTFDGDEVAQNRMARAILGLQAAAARAYAMAHAAAKNGGASDSMASAAGTTAAEAQASITWTLADNSETVATLAELTEALCLAGAAQAAVWSL